MTEVPRTPKRGRPPAFDGDQLLDAADSVGYANLTVTKVAQHLGVRDSTIYNHIESREQLRALAADRALQILDPAGIEGSSWLDYLCDFGLQLRDVCFSQPGLADYYLHGPYLERTLTLFDAQIAALRKRMPAIDDSYAFVLASHASSTTLVFLGSPMVDEETVRRVLRHTVPALHTALSGEAPAGINWDEIRASRERVSDVPRALRFTH